MNKNNNVEFVNAAGTQMVVRMTKGKSGISVRVSLEVKGQDKAVTGCRHMFALTEEADAQKAYDALQAEAKAQGWVEPAGDGVKTIRKQAFTSIPKADEAAPAKAAAKKSA